LEAMKVHFRIVAGSVVMVSAFVSRRALEGFATSQALLSHLEFGSEYFLSEGTFLHVRVQKTAVLWRVAWDSGYGKGSSIRS
jgi:hypothetical protein